MNWAASSRYVTARLPSTSKRDRALRTGSRLATTPRPPASAPSAANTKMNTSTTTPCLASYFPLGIPSRGPGIRFCEHGLGVDHGVLREARQLVLTPEDD